MADIRPFQGVHYNPSITKDLAKTICPPYDIITPQMQQELYQRSDYNFVRIEYGKEMPQDKDTFNKYTRAANTLKSWLDQQILVIDEKPSLYINEHTFTHQGKQLRRHSISCLVKLEDWNKMIVRPHEGTLARAKSDRLSMLWALRANTSPVMSLYEDKGKEIAGIIKTQINHKPLLRISNMDGESQRIWAITSDEIIKRIKDCLSDQPLYIADGHHRYESALVYQRERHSTSPSSAKEASYDFVMMTLMDITDPGLVILPAHRLVRGMEQAALDDLQAGLNTFFDVKDYAIEKDIKTQISTLLAEDTDKTKLLLCGLKLERLQVITIRDLNAILPMFPAFHSEFYQKLDVSIVDHVILEELLGLSHEKAGTFLDYNYDAETAVKRVLNKEYQLAIIVNPVKPEVIKAIADSGDRMPRKSTYFYPKVPAGLLSYCFA
ncbi:MAG: hypothetical protein A2Y89_06400 [Chloroflexi bacterium RBG_13_51_18]|nr:MAG: hypothetical protein A2Y89_06400 [Chloroflexi bacterium RBG_13_51_18]